MDIRMSTSSAIILLLCSSLTITMCMSCEDFLGDVTPGSSLPLYSGLDNPDALETFLIGTYALLASGADELMVGLTDIATEDTGGNCGAGTGWVEFCQNDIIPDNGILVGMWRFSYEVINQTNIIIESVDQLLSQGGIDPARAEQLLGEAYFLRGVVYFELTRVFALPYHCESPLGVPILTVGVDNTNKITLPARDSVQSVYAQSINDLTEALERLPKTKGAADRASYYAVVAYLAEIAFQKAVTPAEYTSVADMAYIIIESGQYDLVTPADVYFRNKGTSEEIWSVKHSGEESGSLYTMTQSNRAQQFGLSNDLLDRAYGKIITDAQWIGLRANEWLADDQRYSILTNNDTFELKSTKYSDRFGGDNLPAMRYAEIILMYAECLARLDQMDEAITYLNMIRERAIVVTDSAGNIVSDDAILFSTDDFANKDELIEAIILERQVELIMEGNRFHDLIRLRRPVNGLDYKHAKLRWPIPQREIDANPNLMQNPDY